MPWLSLVAVAATFAYPVIVMAVDAVILARSGEQWTISEVILRASRKRPIIPFMFGFGIGFLAAHLFFPQIVIEGR